MIQDLRSVTGRSIEALRNLVFQELALERDLEHLATPDQKAEIAGELVARMAASLLEGGLAKVDLGPRSRPEAIREAIRVAVRDIRYLYARLREIQALAIDTHQRVVGLADAVEERLAAALAGTTRIAPPTEDGSIVLRESFLAPASLGPVGNERVLATVAGAGILTLPVDQEESVELEAIRLIEGSLRGGSLDAAVDGDPSTAVRLETGPDGRIVLELDLTAARVVNGLRLEAFADPANPVRIERLETRLAPADPGVEQVAVLEAAAGPEDAAALLEIGPGSARNAFVSTLPFPPVATELVRITLRSFGDEPAEVDLRDLAVLRTRYAARGLVEVAPVDLLHAPGAAYLEVEARDLAPVSELGYQVSIDDGATWTDLTRATPTSLPAGVDGPPRVRTRLRLERFAARFDGLVDPRSNETRTILERFDASRLPLEVGLETTPIAGSLRALVPVARIGAPQGFSLAPPSGDDLAIPLPIAVRPRQEQITVNGEPWTRVASLAGSAQDDRHYTLDYEDGTVRFGDNVAGKRPDGPIRMILDAEPVIVPMTTPATIRLANPHDYDRSAIAIERVAPIVRATEETLASTDARRFDLAHDRILRSREVLEQLPLGTDDFWLEHVPVDLDAIEFDDRGRFAVRVTDPPEADGEYSLEPLVADLPSPVRVRVYGGTRAVATTLASYAARGRIRYPASSYVATTWTTLIGGDTLATVDSQLELYEPLFTQRSLFAREQPFRDGASELTAPGDYSIDLRHGRVYAFSASSEDGAGRVDYSYRAVTPVAWSFGEGSDELVLDESAVRVHPNDLDPVVLVQNNERQHVLYRDRWILVPYRSDVTDTSSTTVTTTVDGEAIAYTAADLLRGYLLPAGRRKVPLPATHLVRGSLRFLPLGNDRVAFGERVLDENGALVPLQVKDARGAYLRPDLERYPTQRDLDRRTFLRERAFVDGTVELERAGDYSVDYVHGVLYLYTGAPAGVVVQYESTDIRVRYRAARELVRDTELLFDAGGRTVTVVGLGDTPSENGTLTLVYRTVDRIREDPTTILEHTTPYLFGYRLRLQS